MKNVFVFVYAKGNEIKVLDTEQSKLLDGDLKKDGWKHTTTLDACIFIEHLHNNCDDAKKEIKNLSKTE
jgi:hypothetical protein